MGGVFTIINQLMQLQGSNEESFWLCIPLDSYGEYLTKKKNLLQAKLQCLK